MKKLLILLALFGAAAAVPSQADAGWRHRCRDCGPYSVGYATPYYYGGYYSSAYRWGGGYSPYNAYYGGITPYGYPGYGATWGFGVGGF